MTRLETEIHECIQGGGLFSLFVLSVDGKRVYASEEFDYLRRSPTTLESEEDAVILAWDRNSWEMPSAGPDMDEKYLGDLRIRREGDYVIFEALWKDSVNRIGQEWKQVWDKVVSRFPFP